MKMDDDELLSLLRKKEDDAGHYVWGELGTQRELSMREYHRLPYGNEEDGWSQIVSSDIQDTVEWILPSLLKIFTSTDKAVSFEPTRSNDVAGAEQATEACNYVFYKQNNGFMVLYTAFKDALTVRNCAVMWRKETTQFVSSEPFKGATAEMLAMLMEGDNTEIEQAEEQTVETEMGPVTVYNGRIKRTEDKTIVKIEAFSPEELLVEKDWTSPLLEDCPYVCRMLSVTTSDLKQMGFDVTAEELRGSSNDQAMQSTLATTNLTDAVYSKTNDEQTDDDSMAEGWMRIEFVLVDVDGDGIAERRCIYRLQDKILKSEVVSHVQVATFSPIINTHRWDGMSMADAVSDLQKLHTELLRQTINSANLANNPRTKVVTDANWTPLANMDDLLDNRPGGVLRMRSMDAIQEYVTPFVAGATMPMLEYVKTMRENRTGVTSYNQGLNADSLNKTASGITQIMTASQQRIELIARIAAEVLLKPIFQGILKLLTDGGMEKLAFRLRDQFVEYDPNEWRNQYDMSINVGLGTGDKAVQAGALQMIYQLQQAGMQIGLADQNNLYHTMSKIVENAGYKDVENFIKDPQNGKDQKLMQAEQAIQQLQAQLGQATKELQDKNVELQIKAFDARTKRFSVVKPDGKPVMNDPDHSFDAWKVQFDAHEKRVQIDMQAEAAERLELLKQKNAAIVGQETAEQLDEEGNPLPDPVLSAIDNLTQGVIAIHQKVNEPQIKEVVRGPDGLATGINVNGVFQPIQRDQSGRILGV